MKIVAALHEALMLTEGESFTINLIVSLVQDIMADAGVAKTASYNYISTRIAKMRECGEVVQVGKEGKAMLVVLTAKYILNQQNDSNNVILSRDEYDRLLSQGVVITQLQSRIRELMCPDVVGRPTLRVVDGAVHTC